MEKYLDQKLLVTLVAFVAVIVFLTWAYYKFVSPMTPAGAISQGDYDKLTDAEKLAYKKVGDYYVKA